MSAGKGFVLVVCGRREHLRRLDEALAFLRAFSRQELLVVTDPSRNEHEIAGVRVLEATTPAALDERGAAIWLKASLPELLPDHAPRCYLDTDVLAISPEVDALFDAFVPPATFASDLPARGSDLRRFSRHAVVCPCHQEGERLEAFFARLDALTALHRAHGDLAALDEPGYYRGARFEGERRRGKWWSGWARADWPDGSPRFEQEFDAGRPRRIRYFFSGHDWILEKRAGEARGTWRDGSGHTFRWIDLDATGYWEDGQGDSFRRLRRADGAEEGWWFRAGVPRRRWAPRPDHDHGGVWLDADGEDLGECDHLAEGLERALGVTIPDRRWVPWNGGLFLYSEASRALFAAWRRALETLWSDPLFVPRDQGALVAAVHASGLADHPRLDPRYNRIVDRNAAERPSLPRLLLEERAAFLHLIDGGLGGADAALRAELLAHRDARAETGG